MGGWVVDDGRMEFQADVVVLLLLFVLSVGLPLQCFFPFPSRYHDILLLMLLFFKDWLWVRAPAPSFFLSFQFPPNKHRALLL